MDPASVIGIAGAALHYVRLLVGEVENIINAPEAVRLLKDDLVVISNALTSLQAITEPEWESLGEAVVTQSKDATTKCKESCSNFRVALARWTRHSSDGKLSWQDRAMVGFFKQDHIASMSRQLQNCKATLTSLASTATL